MPTRPKQQPKPVDPAFQAQLDRDRDRQWRDRLDVPATYWERLLQESEGE